MKTLAALIFCISVILLVYLSGAINKKDRYIQALQPIQLYESVECMENCSNHKKVIIVPEQTKVKLLARLQGQTKTVVRVEYQNTTGWFTYDDKSALILDESENNND